MLIQNLPSFKQSAIISNHILSYIITNLVLVLFCEKFSTSSFSSTIVEVEFSMEFNVSCQESMSSINFTKPKVAEGKSTVNEPVKCFLRMFLTYSENKKTYVVLVFSYKIAPQSNPQ